MTVIRVAMARVFCVVRHSEAATAALGLVAALLAGARLGIVLVRMARVGELERLGHVKVVNCVCNLLRRDDQCKGEGLIILGALLALLLCNHHAKLLKIERAVAVVIA